MPAATVLVRGARLLDPRTGLDGPHGPARQRRPHRRAGGIARRPRRCRDRGRRGPARLPGLRRPARAPSHARSRGRGGPRLRHARGRRGWLLRDPGPAEHRAGRRLGAGAALAARASARRGAHPDRLPGRDHRRAAGRPAHRDGRAGRRRRGRLHRRRPAGPFRRRDAPGSPVPAARRPPARTARGGPVAVGPGRDARGRGVGAARPGRDPVGVGVGAGGARLRAGRPTRRGASTSSTCPPSRPSR